MAKDSLGSFSEAVLAVRWGATAISLALASPEIADGDRGTLAALIALVALTAYRTVRPLRDTGDRRLVLHVVVEMGVSVGAVAVTGYDDSPLLFSLLTPAALAGFARGFALGVRIALVAIVALGVPWVLGDHHRDDGGRVGLQWAGEIVLVALVAGYARRISGEADLRREAAMDRLGRLTDANVLLFQLHQVTQTLPASLDLTDVLDTTMEQLRELFPATGVAILLHEEADLAWHTVRRHGLQAAPTHVDGALPAPLARTVAVRSTAHVDDLAAAGPGLDGASRAGLYGPLMARGSTIGLIALEHGVGTSFTDRDEELLTGFVDAAALAIDNARWFGRLRSVGADEERARIARDLHDRTGQSLAYVAFELDRITKQAAKGADTTASLDALRGDVRKVVGELRDTLYDLRTDVTDADGLVSTLEAFLARVGQRSGLETDLRSEESARLPRRQERELWSIAREAITNVERHARATRVEVTWRCDGTAAHLEVEDDGVGMASVDGGSLGAPGLVSLRERAAGIGATLSVVTGPGRGTRVRCTLAGSPAPREGGT
ncbi:MAG TPA: GAF domain-containing sensor histidine kinase [Acidimicrobiales bacterium]|nr:GAF domain-containing sensor histidine kinase [Acidimicrobiales bacterium]